MAKRALGSYTSALLRSPPALSPPATSTLPSGSPEPFYLKQGFVSTGEFLHDELVLKMTLG